MKCDDDNTVRCCGASGSYVVGESNVSEEAPKVEITTTEGHQPDISSTLNADDVHENEIPDAVRESDENSEVRSIEDEGNIENFHSKQRLNGEIDEETAESESIPKTANTELQHEHHPLNGAEGGVSDAEIIPSVPKSNRQPKNLDNVVAVYPNIMSGIPKTTPRNMPETNEMTMFDQEMGMDLHLVFSKTTVQPEPHVQEETTSTLRPTSKQPPNRFAKRRRQYKPIQRITTESPVADVELKPTTKRSTVVSRQRSRVRNFNTTLRTTAATTKPRRSRVSTKAPITEDEDEILQTSDDDKSHQNRFRLFNARHRLNYLRRNTTTTTTTTTTESPIEITTLRSIKSKTSDIKRPLRVDENLSKITIDERPTRMNETLIRVMDANHRNMISKVRVALKAAATENVIVEIPRSFASVEMDRRVKKIEQMLANKMINAYTETKAKRRGDQPKKDSNIGTAQTPISTSNSTRPFRGRKKFQMSDLLEKTVIVPMSPSQVKRMRMRNTTVRPTVEDVIVTTTRRPRRRPTKVQPNASAHSIDEKKTDVRENTEERDFRRGVNMRRRFTAQSQSTETTTLSSPVRTTSESIPSIDPTTVETISTKITTTPETTTTTQATIESTVVSQDELAERSQEDESTQIDIEENVTTINPPSTENSDVLSDFKPSPLWSISSDEKTDFIDREQNHSYEMAEETLLKGHRRSRSSFDPPVYYLNGFVPLTSVTGPIKIIGPIPKPIKLRDTKAKYSLPREGKAQFSKN